MMARIYKRILSFDPAYKTLGVCDLQINLDMAIISAALNILRRAISIGNLDVAETAAGLVLDQINSVIKVMELRTVDILGGRASDISLPQKSIALSKFLQEYPASRYDAVIIEDQPIMVGGKFCAKTATESPIVAHQICYHFAPIAVMINPRAKGKLAVAGTLAEFKLRFPTAKKARKAHSVAGARAILGGAQVDDHCADALMQIWAYFAAE